MTSGAVFKRIVSKGGPPTGPRDEKGYKTRRSVNSSGQPLRISKIYTDNLSGFSRLEEGSSDAKASADLGMQPDAYNMTEGDAQAYDMDKILVRQDLEVYQDPVRQQV